MIIFKLRKTGRSIINDKIVEIYAMKLIDNNISLLHKLINPGFPIPQSATNHHGITDDMVNNKPTFEMIAYEIEDFFKGEDLIGFKNSVYDNLFLEYELSQCNIDFNLQERKIVDLFQLWERFEGRNFKGALKRFLNKVPASIQSAEEETNDLFNIFKLMKDIYFSGEGSINEMAREANPESQLCYDRLYRDDDGDLIFNFGIYSGLSVTEVNNVNPGYIRWLIDESDTLSAVKFIIGRELRLNRIR